MAYEFTVEARGRDDDGMTTWRLANREVWAVPFAVDDESGRARVLPEGPRLVLDCEEEHRSNVADEDTARESAVLAQYHHPFLEDSALRYRESVIEVGEHVAVFGYGEVDFDAGPDEVQVEIRATEQTRLCISNKAAALNP